MTMLLILVVAALFGAFVSKSGWVAGIAGATLVLGFILWLLYALVVAGMRCDESCDGMNPDEWSDDRGAWQWTAQFGVAVVGTTLAVTALVLLARAHRRAASQAMGGAVVAFAVWALVVIERL